MTADPSVLAQCRTALDTYAPAVLGHTHTPGVSIAYMDRTGTTFAAAYGFADLAASTALTPEHVMRCGSMAKPYIATSVLSLVERGLLDLYEPANTFIEAFRIRNPFGRRHVTLYDLITHQSGLATDTYDASLSPPPDLEAYLMMAYRSRTMAEYRGTCPRWTAPVGTRFQYSTLGMATLAYVVSCVDPHGRSFPEILSEDIATPLNLGRTSLPGPLTANGVTTPSGPEHATGYARIGQWCVPTPHLYSATYPASSLVTTPADQCRLLIALLNGGTLDGSTLLQPDTVADMIRPHARGSFPGTAADNFMGLGIEVSRLPGRAPFFGHGGAYPFGWWGLSRAFPDYGFAIAAACNAWDIMRFHNPHGRSAPGLLLEFVANAIIGAPGKPTAPESPGYAAGLLLGERVRGLLGATEVIPDAVIREITAGARLAPAHDRAAQWRDNDFADALRAINSIDGTPGAIRAFVQSDSCRVAPATLDLMALDFGATRATFPVPMEFWADCIEAATTLEPGTGGSV